VGQALRLSSLDGLLDFAAVAPILPAASSRREIEHIFFSDNKM
jgi:hypothetical protein